MKALIPPEKKDKALTPHFESGKITMCSVYL